jgi:hypothetical protein
VPSLKARDAVEDVPNRGCERERLPAPSGACLGAGRPQSPSAHLRGHPSFSWPDAGTIRHAWGEAPRWLRRQRRISASRRVDHDPAGAVSRDASPMDHDGPPKVDHGKAAIKAPAAPPRVSRGTASSFEGRHEAEARARCAGGFAFPASADVKGRPLRPGFHVGTASSAERHLHLPIAFPQLRCYLADPVASRSLLPPSRTAGETAMSRGKKGLADESCFWRSPTATGPPSRPTGRSSSTNLWL